MARVTIEDCLHGINNRFDLVLLASRRARQLTLGHQPRVEWENDKPTVVALREIAEGLVGREVMDEIDARAHALAATIDEETVSAEL